MGAVKTLFTFEEFERMEEKPGRQELIHGELIELPPPELQHQNIAHCIYDELRPALRQARERNETIAVGRVYHETGYKFPDQTYLTPDVSVTHASQAEGKYLEGAPAIAIEIISPGNTPKQMDAKMKIYFEFGALEVWRVNQKERTFTICTPDSSRVIGEDGVVTTPLIPGLSLNVAAVFAA
jgi:Uma2 family endonuclease